MKKIESEYSVLVVDDDGDTRYAIAKILGKCGCDITEVGSVEDALIVLSKTHFDIVFSDMRFHGGMDGEELLDAVSQLHPDMEVVLMSCSMDVERKDRLMAKGATRCLEKPFYTEVCIETLADIGDSYIRKAA